MSRKEKTSIFELSWDEITAAYVIRTLMVLAIFGLLCIFWAKYALFSIGDLWSSHPDIVGGIGKVWFIFVWGAVVTLGIGILNRGVPRTYAPSRILGHGIWLSLNAGFFEEILYRWLRFSIAMITLPFLNLITFGLIKWVYDYALVPLADWVTFGALHHNLYDPRSWVVGAAIISANGIFRDAHKESGFFAQVNAWFIGMVLFYLMFNYGIQTAIVVHVLYDAVIFVVVALATSWRPVAYSRLWNLRTPSRTRQYNN